MADPVNLPHRRPPFTREQFRLAEALRARDGADRYRFVDIYAGAVWAKGQRDNPESIAHSAQSMRELLDKLTITIEGAVVRVALPDLSAQLKEIRDSYTAAQDSSKCFNRSAKEWSGEIDTPILNVFRRIEKAIEHGRRFLSKKERSKKFLQALPLGQTADVAAQHAFAKRWASYDRFFHSVAHHDVFPGETEYELEFDGCTQMLLEQLNPPASDVLTVLDKLVDEAEGNA